MKETIYNCPLCKTKLIAIKGTRMDINNGITLRCNGAECPTNENIEGHGKNEARAYEIVLAKYSGKSLQNEETEDEPAVDEAPKETSKPREVVAVDPPVKRGRGRPATRVRAVELEELPL